MMLKSPEKEPVIKTAFSGLFKGKHKIRNRTNIFHKFSPYENNLQYNVLKIKENMPGFHFF